MLKTQALSTIQPAGRLAALLLLLCLPAQALGVGNGRLELTVVDRDTGRPIACRMHLKNAAGKPRRAGKAPFWHDHFVFDGKIVLELPVGQYTFELERGPEYLNRLGHFTIENFADDQKQVDLGRFIDMAAKGWWSGDLDVRRRGAEIELLMAAEDLHVAQVVNWGNDGRTSPSALPEKPLVCFHGDCCYHLLAGAHQRAGTELLYFHLPKPLVLPGRGEYPPLVRFAAAAHQHEGAWVDLSRPYWWDLPLLAAAHQIDSIQVAHGQMCRETVIGNEGRGRARDRFRYPDPWGNGQWSHFIYFQLLECGLRIPPSAGSGSGVSPNPVGYNRVYVFLDSAFSYERWWEGLRAGRVFVTNGPLMLSSVRGEPPGHVFRAPAGGSLDLEIGLTLSTRQPISYLEIVKNGRVERSIRFEDYAKSGRLPKLHFDRSGWFLLRAVTDLPKTYRFAMTGPYYVEIGPQRRISRAAAKFFLDWEYERARQIKLADPKQQDEVIDLHRRARDFWQMLVEKANAE